MAIDGGFLPPTLTLTPPDDGFGRWSASPAQPAELPMVQNHGFAFGGNNAITMFGRAA